MARGKGDQLLLPGGEQPSAFTHFSIVALGQPHDELMGVNQFRRPFHLFIRGVELAVADVFPDSSGEEVGVLEHAAQIALEPGQGPFPVIHSIDEDSTP